MYHTEYILSHIHPLTHTSSHKYILSQIRLLTNPSSHKYILSQIHPLDVGEVLDLDFVWQVWCSVDVELLWDRFPQWQGCPD